MVEPVSNSPHTPSPTPPDPQENHAWTKKEVFLTIISFGLYYFCYLKAQLAAERISALPGNTPAIDGVAQPILSPVAKDPSKELAAQSNTTPKSSKSVAKVQANTIPLIQESKKHKALRIYDEIAIPKDTTIVLSASVFDGLDNLEHLSHAAQHLIQQRQKEPFKLFLWLESKQNVSDTAWDAKLQALSQLGVDGIYCVGLSVQQNRIAVSARTELQKQIPPPCVINIGSQAAFFSIPAIGSVTEYGMGTPLDHIMDKLPTGFRSDTAGLWIRDDRVLSPSNPVASERVKMQLFGSILPDQEMKKWEVGFASLRKDDARLTWIGLRIRQVEAGKNCSLIVSPFESPDLEQRELSALAQQYGFNCVIVGPDGQEQPVIPETPGWPMLRIVHPFIAEEDLPAVLQLAKRGSLGGAGDTACLRGLLGEFPVFVEFRPSTSMRWTQVSHYLKGKGFPRLAEWFAACAVRQYQKLEHLMDSPELIQEWQDFRQQAREELDIGPWMDRHVRRCVSVSREPKIRTIEARYLSGMIDPEKYQAQIRDLTQSSGY